MNTTYKGRKVYVEVDYSGAACDAYFGYGEWLDTLEEMSEDDLIKMSEECQDVLAEYCLEQTGYWRE